MKKLTLPLCLLAAATLAACGSPQVRTDDTSVAGTTARPGSATVVFVVDPEGPVANVSTQRVWLAMQDGSTQIIDRRGDQLSMREHIRLR